MKCFQEILTSLDQPKSRDDNGGRPFGCLHSEV